MMKRHILFVACLFVTSTAWALEVEGVGVSETVEVSGKTLQLNGVGVRTKFFFDIYIGALYLPKKTTDVAEILDMNGPKQIAMTFLYSEVAREKLVSAWDEGFRLNQSEESVARLLARIEKFNTLFTTAHQGDVYQFNLTADGSTAVLLNGKIAGQIEGADFQRALLLIWLGEKPADYGLKEAMLGG